MTTSFFFKSVEKWEKFWILLRITLGIILFSSQSGKRSLLNFLYIYIRSVIWQTLRKKNHGEPVTRPWYRPTDLTPVRNKFIGYVQDGKTGVAYEKDVYIAIFIVPALFFVFFFLQDCTTRQRRSSNINKFHIHHMQIKKHDCSAISEFFFFNIASVV